MNSYLLELKDWIFVKGYAFLTFPKIISKNIGKNICKILRIVQG